MWCWDEGYPCAVSFNGGDAILEPNHDSTGSFDGTFRYVSYASAEGKGNQRHSQILLYAAGLIPKEQVLALGLRTPLSLYLAVSRRISPDLAGSRRISLDLAGSRRISPDLAGGSNTPTVRRPSCQDLSSFPPLADAHVASAPTAAR